MTCMRVCVLCEYACGGRCTARLRGERIARVRARLSWSSSSSSSSSLPSSWRSSSVHGPADGVVTGSSSHAAQAICRKKHARGSHYGGRCSRGLMLDVRISQGSGLGDFETVASPTSSRGHGPSHPRTLGTDGARRRRETKFQSHRPRLFGSADPRTRGSSRDDRIDGRCDEIILSDFNWFIRRL